MLTRSNSVGICGLSNGRVVVACSEDLAVLVTWNRSLTFQVWAVEEDPSGKLPGTRFREIELGWTVNENDLSLSDARYRAELRMREIERSLSGDDTDDVDQESTDLNG